MTVARIYADNGYAIIPQQFIASEVDVMRKAAAEVAEREDVHREFAAHRRTRLAFWPSRVSLTLDAVRTDPRLLAILAPLLGTTSLRSGTAQMYYRSPGDPDSFWWHQDVIFRDAMWHPERYVQAAVFLDDVTTVDQGAILFVPGSHRREEPPGLWQYRDVMERKGGPWALDTRYGDWEPLLVNAGDVAIWHPLVIHASQPNVTARWRRYYMVGYADAAAVGEAYPWAWRNGEEVGHAIT